jgi:hypothetical protein
VQDLLTLVRLWIAGLKKRFGVSHKMEEAPTVETEQHDYSGQRVTTADVDAMDDRTPGQKRLMKYLIEADDEGLKRFDKVLVEALDARDQGHVVEAESLFREAIVLAEDISGDEGYLLLPALLHFAAFLEVLGREQEAEAAETRYRKLSALYR